MIYEKIYDTLEQIGYPVREQGTYKSGEVLPETFVTFFIIDSPGISHADNVATARNTRVQISLYSKKPSIVQISDSTLKNVLIPEGFMRIGGRPLSYDEKTGHYAWTTDYRLYESEE